MTLGENSSKMYQYRGMDTQRKEFCAHSSHILNQMPICRHPRCHPGQPRLHPGHHLRCHPGHTHLHPLAGHHLHYHPGHPRLHPDHHLRCHPGHPHLHPDHHLRCHSEYPLRRTPRCSHPSRFPSYLCHFPIPYPPESHSFSRTPAPFLPTQDRGFLASYTTGRGLHVG